MSSFELLAHALRHYQHLDPVGWLAVATLMSPVWGVLLISVGFIFLLVGGGRAFRFLAAPLGAVVGLFFGSVVLARLQLPVPESVGNVTVAVCLFVASAVVPQVALFFACGLPLGLLGGQLAGTPDYLLGFFPGFLVGGVTGTALGRALTGVFSAVVGGWLVVLGLAGMFQHTGNLQTVAHAQPWAPVGLALVLALAGALYQVAIRPSPEELMRMRAQRREQRRRRAERRATEDRWRDYHRED